MFFHAPLAAPFTEMKMTVSPMFEADEAAMATDVSKREVQAGLECLKSTPQSSETDASPTPPGINDLREQWWATMAELDNQFGDRDAYWSCVSKKTVDGTSGVQSRGALLELLEARMPPISKLPGSPTSPEASAPEWTGLVQFEQGWQAAEFSRRADVYNAGMDEVRAAIESFSARHATEIAAARDAWRDTVREPATSGTRGGSNRS